MSCTVTFTIRAESTKWGETVGVTGSIPELSTWGAFPPPRLTASPFPIWTITLTLPARTVLEYKYIILSSSKILRWEVLPLSEQNRSLTTPEEGHVLTIDDGTMGDASRTSTTVTPSTSPSTTPSRPQKPSTTITTTTTTTTATATATTTAKSTIQTPPKLERHTLAEFAAQLDDSRRQVEHVRAALRRIRRIPTPDALPTPPSTPDEPADLSQEAAAALVTDTLSEAKEDVDVLRQKLRAVRATKTHSVKPRISFTSRAASLTCAVALLAICVALVNLRIGDYVRHASKAAGDMLADARFVALTLIGVVEERVWAAGRDSSVYLRLRMERGWGRGAMEVWQVVKRTRTRFVLDWLTPLLQAVMDVADGIKESVKKIAARVPGLHVV